MANLTGLPLKLSNPAPPALWPVGASSSHATTGARHKPPQVHVEHPYIPNAAPELVGTAHCITAGGCPTRRSTIVVTAIPTPSYSDTASSAGNLSMPLSSGGSSTRESNTVVLSAEHLIATQMVKRRKIERLERLLRGVMSPSILDEYGLQDLSGLQFGLPHARRQLPPSEFRRLVWQPPARSFPSSSTASLAARSDSLQSPDRQQLHQPSSTTLQSSAAQQPLRGSRAAALRSRLRTPSQRLAWLRQPQPPLTQQTHPQLQQKPHTAGQTAAPAAAAAPAPETAAHAAADIAVDQVAAVVCSGPASLHMAAVARARAARLGETGPRHGGGGGKNTPGGGAEETMCGGDPVAARTPIPVPSSSSTAAAAEGAARRQDVNSAKSRAAATAAAASAGAAAVGAAAPTEAVPLAAEAATDVAPKKQAEAAVAPPPPGSSPSPSSLEHFLSSFSSMSLTSSPPLVTSVRPPEAAAASVAGAAVRRPSAVHRDGCTAPTTSPRAVAAVASQGTAATLPEVPTDAVPSAARAVAVAVAEAGTLAPAVAAAVTAATAAAGPSDAVQPPSRSAPASGNTVAVAVAPHPAGAVAAADAASAQAPAPRQNRATTFPPHPPTAGVASAGETRRQRHQQPQRDCRRERQEPAPPADAPSSSAVLGDEGSFAPPPLSPASAETALTRPRPAVALQPRPTRAAASSATAAAAITHSMPDVLMVGSCSRPDNLATATATVTAAAAAPVAAAGDGAASLQPRIAAAATAPPLSAASSTPTPSLTPATAVQAPSTAPLVNVNAPAPSAESSAPSAPPASPPQRPRPLPLPTQPRPPPPMPMPQSVSSVPAAAATVAAADLRGDVSRRSVCVNVRGQQASPRDLTAALFAAPSWVHVARLVHKWPHMLNGISVSSAFKVLARRCHPQMLMDGGRPEGRALRSMMQHLCFQAEQHLPSMGPREVAGVLFSLASLDYHPPPHLAAALFGAFAHEPQPLLHQHQEQHQEQQDGEEVEGQAGQQHGVQPPLAPQPPSPQLLGRANALDCAHMAWSAARLGWRLHPELLRAAFHRLQVCYTDGDRASVRSLAVFISSATRLGLEPLPEQMAWLEDKLTSDAPLLNCVDVANALTSLARLGPDHRRQGNRLRRQRQRQDRQQHVSEPDAAVAAAAAASPLPRAAPAAPDPQRQPPVARLAEEGAHGPLRASSSSSGRGTLAAQRPRVETLLAILWRSAELLPHTRAEEAAYILYALARMRFRAPPPYTAALLSCCLSLRHACSPQALAMMVWAAPRIRQRPRRAWLEAVLELAARRVHELTPPLLTAVLCGLARASKSPAGKTGYSLEPALVAPFVRQLSELLPYYAVPRDLANAAWALARLPPDCVPTPGSGFWRAMAARGCELGFHNFGPQSLANMLWCFASVVVKRGDGDGDGRPHVSAAAAAKHLFGPADHCDLVSALERTLPDMNCSELSMTLWSLAKLQIDPGAAWVETAARSAVGRLWRTRPRGLSAFVHSLTWIKSYGPSEEVVSALEEAMFRRQASMKSRRLWRGLRSRLAWLQARLRRRRNAEVGAGRQVAAKMRREAAARQLEAAGQLRTEADVAQRPRAARLKTGAAARPRVAAPPPPPPGSGHEALARTGMSGRSGSSQPGKPQRQGQGQQGATARAQTSVGGTEAGMVGPGSTARGCRRTAAASGAAVESSAGVAAELRPEEQFCAGSAMWASGIAEPARGEARRGRRSSRRRKGPRREAVAAATACKQEAEKARAAATVPRPAACGVPGAMAAAAGQGER